MSNISGKSAFVTGSTKGIGLAIAEALAGRGAKVFICARGQEQLDKTIKTLSERYPGKIAGAACDVRGHEQIHAAISEANAKFGGLHILINNAGIGKFSNVEQMAVEDWDATIETNLNGVFYCCHTAIPLMKKSGGGYIINIGSLAGKNAFPGGAAYNASKFGLIGFSEALMQEVRHDNIRVSYIMPGSVNTEFGRGGEQDPATTWKLLSSDVAQVVVNLLEMDPRALASRVELRPSRPPK